MKIYPNKKEATKALIGTSFALLLFAFFGFFDIRSISTEDSMFTLDWFYWVFKSFSISMFVLLLSVVIFFIKTLLTKKPIIEISPTGLNDNSSIISLGFIPWSDMERAYLKGMFFTINLKAPEEYLRRVGTLKRIFIKWNLRMGYGQVCISPILISHKIKEFLYAFAEYKSVEDCEFLNK